jgi:hypothetical protein
MNVSLLQIKMINVWAYEKSNDSKWNIAFVIAILIYV